MVVRVIAGALRIKNESRWIAQVIKSIQPLCGRIVVFDDHSDDGTPEICESLGATVLRSEFQGLDESRDKAFLLNWVRGYDPDWCLMIDGDEILEVGGDDKIRAALNPAVASYSFKITYLWNSMDQVRTDGIYGRFKRGSLFRLKGQPSTAQFRTTGHGGNFHCGNVPQGLIGTQEDLAVALLHLGYMHQEDRIRKYIWYNETDPGNISEDCYRHVAQGDIAEVPAHVRLRHAGPLELRSL